ncbi:uncharacterized protein sS8_0606 [Methylocaldum marinum]|uniref:Uncharacterized protein n=1 Tax=Methylocaldum marinum TaxID=1432792 RepID=A0A250KNM6_9GAMM|nr:hypothetical protein [Methylocaldum marinum]BBA32571.1 uncharacterized protein sS8_0606 [Methylocaldum marinum]
MPETAPYFAIVEQPVTAGDYAREVYQNPESANLAWFFKLNEITRDTYLRPGAVLVLPSAQSQACTAAEVRLAAGLRDPQFWPRGIRGPIEQPEITNRFYELLEYTQTLQTPGGLGAYSYAWGRQIDEVTAILRELQALYRETYAVTGTLGGAAFHRRRQALLNRLDGSLRGWLRRGLVGPDEALIRRRLGLSSKRIVHHWKKAGSADSVPELRSRIAALNRAAKKVKVIGQLGIALDVAWSAAEINRHIEESRPDRNRRIAGEAGRLGGSLVGGFLGGMAGNGVCNLVFGGPTLGTSPLWCAVVVGGVGTLGLGYWGSEQGPRVGEMIYETAESGSSW